MSQSMLDYAMKRAEEVIENEKESEQKDMYKPDNEERRYKSNIIAQITHFYQEKPNTLQIEQEDPSMKGNFPKQGSITIRMKKEESNVAFKLNCGEALQLADILSQAAKEELLIMKALWKRGRE